MPASRRRFPTLVAASEDAAPISKVRDRTNRKVAIAASQISEPRVTGDRFRTPAFRGFGKGSLLRSP